MLNDRNHEIWDATPPAPGEWMEITTVLDSTLPRRRFAKHDMRNGVFCEIRTLEPIEHGVVLDYGLMAYFYVEHHSKDDKNTIEIVSPFDNRVLFDHTQEAFKLNWQPWNWVDENGMLYRSTPSVNKSIPCLVGTHGVTHPAIWEPTKGFVHLNGDRFREYIEWWCFMPKPPERGDNVISFQGMETD